MSELTAEIRDVEDYGPGLRAFTTPRGIRVIEIDYWVNPTHDPAWANEQRRLYHTTKSWRREMERDWSTPAGDPYFPEFTEIGSHRFTHMAESLIKGPVFRTFDLGGRRPAAHWFQYTKAKWAGEPPDREWQWDRLWFYREFMPHDVMVHQFVDAVKYLSNELEYSALDKPSREWVDVYAAKPSGAHCPPPWFPKGVNFLNVAGKEALQGSWTAKDPADKITADIFAARGIPLITVNPRVLGRNEVVRRFLRVYKDGWPGVFMDPQMEETIEGFNGYFCYEPLRGDKMVSDKPKKDGHYDNLLDSFGYGVVAVAPDDVPPPPKPSRLVGWKGGRTPIYANQEDQVLWNEVVRRDLD